MKNVESNINTPQILNNFFSSNVNNLKIVENVNCDPISDNINDPNIKLIVKYRDHPSILKIRELCNRKQCFLFSFSDVDEEQVSFRQKQMKIQTFPQKLLKIILSGFNNAIKTSIVTSNLKWTIFWAAIWLPYGQLWAILKGTTSLTRC